MCTNEYKIGPYADLREADLRDVKLRDAQLHRAYLRDANMSRADLRGADLHGADLRGADLHGADLRGADLHGADLCGANLHDALLHGADLYDALLHGADLNWNSHNLLSEILRQKARKCSAKRCIAGLVLISKDWCWGDFLNLEHPEKDWAIKILKSYSTEKSPYPH